MIFNDFGGLFVAFDGPNGVGKSTLIEKVCANLEHLSVDIWVTKEPTNTLLGEFTRQIAESLEGESLACLVASDRYCHLRDEVIPKLKNDYLVITDRYILSSLILQRMDNVNKEFILAINEKVILPDLQIVVTADKKAIQTRLSERNNLTRFERGQRTDEELAFLREGVNELSRLGTEVIEIDNTGGLNDSVVSYDYGKHFVDII